jgi:hypothetical protein
MEKKYPIKEEWKEYYEVLEGIRRTGFCNMFEASIYLEEFCPELKATKGLAKEILCSWITNYDELDKKYNFR